MVTLDAMIRFFKELPRVYQDHADWLNQLDAAIGDADHGTNMARGFVKVGQQLQDNPPTSIKALLQTAGMGMIRNVGGAAGPLYGTFFIKAAQASQQYVELGNHEFSTLCKVGVDAVAALGKAALGDKTMLDALVPTVETMANCLALPFPQLLQHSAAAAKAGMENTTPLIAKKGRASYLGERSRGHQDPGATSVYLFFKTAAACLAA